MAHTIIRSYLQFLVISIFISLCNTSFETIKKTTSQTAFCDGPLEIKAP